MKATEQLPASSIDEVFSTSELAACVNVAVHEIDYWVDSGLVTPSVQKANGHGSRKLFSVDDVRQAMLVRRLRQAEWKPKQVGKALAALACVLANPDTFDQPILIHEGSALLILCQTTQRELTILDAATPGQYVMVIALETLEQETRNSIARSK